MSTAALYTDSSARSVSPAQTYSPNSLAASRKALQARPSGTRSASLRLDGSVQPMSSASGRSTTCAPAVAAAAIIWVACLRFPSRSAPVTSIWARASLKEPGFLGLIGCWGFGHFLAAPSYTCITDATDRQRNSRQGEAPLAPGDAAGRRVRRGIPCQAADPDGRGLRACALDHCEGAYPRSRRKAREKW